jgi:peptidyl-prolyl cis-trans isomerase SurA
MTMFSPTLRFVRWSLLAELGFALACSSSWAQTTQPSPSSGRDFIVAVVDAQPITNHEVNMRANVLSQQLRQQQKPVPQQMDLLRTSLERLITEKALLQHAKEVGIAIDNDAVAVAEQRSAAQNQTTVDAMHKKARAEGSSPEALQQGIKDQLTLQRLSERNVPGRIKISDAEIDQAIRDRQSANVDTNPDIELGHVLVAVPESANESQIAALRAKAEAALSRLKRGDDLGVVAKEMSDGAERDKGGLMGVRPANRYPSLFVENTQKLSVGAVSPIFRSGAGFHILKLVSKRSNNTITVTETNARHILLRPGGQLSQTTARAQLTEFKRQIEAGKADFAKLAQQHSQDASASAGGDLGWVATGMFVPEFEEVMNKLEPGQIADPTVSRFGVHLIQVITRRQAPISERELRDMTRNHLRDKKFDETYQLWAQEVRGRAYVEYRDAPQ